MNGLVGFARIVGRWSIPPAALAVIPAVYFALVIIGACRWFSPVPFWDMWDGYAISYLDVLGGHPASFFLGQANEHRILFSKLLFWADLRFFGGESRFLVVCNVALMVLLWVTFSACARRLLRGHGDLWIIVALSIAAPAFSWLQEPNITWGYQSQFFVAYLFPLLAFACLALSREGRHSTLWFGAALVCGVASLGTMANGLFVLPLMVVLSFLLGRPSFVRLTSICFVGGLAIFAWFQGYVSGPHDPPDVLEFIDFVVSLFGGPFDRVVGHTPLTYVVGAAFIAISIYFAVRWFLHSDQLDPMFAALVIFIAYVGATGASMAYGRATMEPNASMIMRYTTPTLMAWCAFALLSADTFKNARSVRLRYAIVGVLIALSFLPRQLRAFSDDGPIASENKALAALALMMKVEDPAAFSKVYPMNAPERLVRLKWMTETLTAAQISIFADPRFTKPITRIGSDSSAGFHACRGEVNAIRPLVDDMQFRRVAGFAWDNKGRGSPQFIYIAANGKIVGLAVTGMSRIDLARRYGRKRRYSGFEGYVLAAAADAPLSVVCAD